MPLYEYHCNACGQRMEVLQRLHDAPLVECPHCGGALTKLLSAPALQFKGSGFYLTDYGRSGASKPDTAAEKPETAKESKPAADPKPAADTKSPAESARSSS